ncbi:MAG: MATE family efflux transporter [Lachnospiraceae bacterium]|nr:MATE family efflux transporter [Lachnospiraceae bacterium]
MRYINLNTNDNFGKRLRSLVLPMTFQYFMYALVPVADAVMLVALNQDAMSSVSLAAQVSFVRDLFLFAITTGASMLAAQYWGKGDIASIEKLLGYIYKLALPIALVFFTLTLIVPGAVIRIFTDEPEIVRYGISYLRVVSFSCVLMSLASIELSIMKNIGQVKEATVISIIMVLTNVCLNAVFIYGLLGLPQMETAGAALATTISALVGYLLCVFVRLKKKVLRFKISSIFSTPKEITSIYRKHTFPVLLNQLTWGIGFTMISVIMGHLGSDAIAANSIVAVVKDLISCFCFALSTAGSILVGNELGAGRLDEARVCGRKVVRLAIVSGAVAGLVILALSPLIVSAVNLTDQAKDYLFWMLVMCVYYMVGRSINGNVITGIFTAGGDTKFGFICDTITMWGFIVPVGALAAFVFELPVLAVFFILNLDEIVKLPAVYIHYKKYKWVRNLVD